MIFDLQRDIPDNVLEADVCVIGGGPAGLVLARALLAQGKSVALLDAGPLTPVMHANGDGFNQGLRFVRRIYGGALAGRAFGLGGTSSAWGGQLLPLRHEEMAERPAIGAPAWPLAYAEIARYYSQLEHWLGVDSAPFDAADRHWHSHPFGRLRLSGLRPRFSKWISFRQRNLGRAWQTELRQHPRLHGWVNARVSRWHGDTPADKSGQKITTIEALGPQGQVLQVQAGRFVVCAGALESTRLLFALDAQTGAVNAQARNHLGHYLHDHCSIRIASLQATDRKRLIQMFAPCFNGSTMHSLRLDLAPESLQHLPAAYAHVVCDAPQQSGFAALRDTLRSLQRGDIAAMLAASLRLLAALPELFDIAGWRVLGKRLAFPAKGQLYLHLDVEQAPHPDNRIHCDASEGLPLVIDWDLAFDPAAVIDAARASLNALWRDNGLERITSLKFLPTPPAGGDWSKNIYDIYHPAGTTRMAERPEDGVISPDLRVFGTGNVYVLSTSAFPSLGAANPTFTLMALALRLADTLK